MFSKRYTLVLADRTTGVVRRFTVSVKPVLITVVTIVTLPMLIGLGAALKARHDRRSHKLSGSMFGGISKPLSHGLRDPYSIVCALMPATCAAEMNFETGPELMRREPHRKA